MELPEFRNQFAALGSIAWLSTPSDAPAAQPVLAAVRRSLDAWNAGEGSWPERFAPARRTRRQMAALLGAAPSDIALVQSTVQAAATVARSLPPEGTVVVGELEYQSNRLPWLASIGPGVRVNPVAMPDGAVRSQALVDAIDDTTRLVAVSTVQSVSGARVSLAPVAQRCAEVGAMLFLDATQSLGVLRLDPDVRPDFLAVHGYKWLVAPRGAAWLYVRPDRQAMLQPLAPGVASAGEGADALYGPVEMAPDASRLDMSLGFLAWAGAEAALDLIASLDPSEVERHSLALAAYARDELRAAGYRCVVSEQPSHIIGARTEHPESALAALTAAGVRATVRRGLVRLGFHGFNEAADVDRAVAALSGRGRR